jgi:thiamine biosynthesis protein ThiS
MSAGRVCQTVSGPRIPSFPRNPMIPIEVNGEPRTIREGASLLDLLHQLEVEPDRVAVELDRRIVRREAWQATRLAPGSQLEIVQFVGGG